MFLCFKYFLIFFIFNFYLLKLISEGSVLIFGMTVFLI